MQGQSLSSEESGVGLTRTRKSSAAQAPKSICLHRALQNGRQGLLVS
jgi:hypothetical protein